jgi:hypothetical protein
VPRSPVSGGRSHPSTSPGAAWRGRTVREGALMSLTLLRGAYRLVDACAAPGWDPEGNAVSIFAAGVTVPEAVQSGRELRERGGLASVFVVTSPDRLYWDLREPRPHLEVPVVSLWTTERGVSHGRVSSTRVRESAARAPRACGPSRTRRGPPEPAPVYGRAGRSRARRPGEMERPSGSTSGRCRPTIPISPRAARTMRRSFER